MPSADAGSHLLPSVRVTVLDPGSVDPAVLAACTGRLDAVDAAEGGPFRLEVPAAAGVGRRTVSSMVAIAQEEGLGLVLVLVPGLGPQAPVLLAREETLARVRATTGQDDPPLRALAEADGFRWVDGRELKVEDLRSAAPARLVAPPWTPEGRAARGADPTPAPAGGRRGLRRWIRGS